MITNYSRPQLLIRQILEKLEVSADPNLNAFVFGPQYDLNRITNVDEFAEMQGVATDLPDDSTTVQLVPFENFKSGSSIETNYTRLYGKDLEAVLVKYGYCSAGNDSDVTDANLDDTGIAFSILSVQEPNKIVAKDASGDPIILQTDATNTILNPSLRGRPAKSGDIVYVNYKGTTVKRQVVSIERALVAPGTNEIINGGLNPTLTFGNSVPVVTTSVTGNVSASFLPVKSQVETYLAKGARYNGEFSERFTIKVTTPTGKGSANAGRCTVSSSSGEFYSDDVVVSGQAGVADFILGSSQTGIPGLSITADKGVNDGDGLFLGDTFSVSVSMDYVRLANTNFKIVGDYAYKTDDTLVFEVISTSPDSNNPYAGAIVRVTDTAGRMSAQDITLAKDGTLDKSEYVVLGNTGLSFRLQNLLSGLSSYQRGLRVGDVYSIELKVGKSSGPQSILVLNGIAGNTVGRTNSADDLELDCVEFRCAYSGFIPSYRDNDTAQWSSDSRPLVDNSGNPNFGINVFTGLRVNKTDRNAGYRWLSVTSGSRGSRLYSHYKAFVPAITNEKIVWSDKLTSLAYGGTYANFGKVDVENPIGFGLSRALSGANGRGVYIGRVESIDEAGYSSILDKAERNANIYALCPLTDDYKIQKLVSGHVDNMSTEAKKRWRRAYIGTNSPVTYETLGASTTTGARNQATVTEYLGANTRVVDELGTFMDLKIIKGDLFRTNFRISISGEEIHDEYKVDAVVTNEELILQTGPATGIVITKDYELHKSDSVLNIIDYIGERSSKFSSRRVVNVWVDKPQFDTTDFGNVTLNNYFVAAEIAGLRSAVQAQQGLTNTEVTSVTSAPSMYTKFTEDQLDDIAEAGVWVVTQDYENGSVYIRHQLTTDSNNGNMYYEDSVGTNLDEISYAVNNVLYDYIGKRNATQGTVQEIYNDVFGLLFERTTADAEVIVGPALLGFTNLEVKIDADYKDRVNVSVSLELPLPLNSIVVTLRAYASYNEGEAVQEVAADTDTAGRLYNV